MTNQFQSIKYPTSLSDLLTLSPYQNYVYSYPHKKAYRPLKKPVKLSDVWSLENRESLYLYIHIPFCEMRCGFCNLFTLVEKNDDSIEEYINTLTRQTKRVKQALNTYKITRFALGGGTPTRLPLKILETVLNLAENISNGDLQNIPSSVEVSPETATKEKLKLLSERKIDRLSIGVQSFIDREVLAIQRRQKADRVKATLSRIKNFNFPILNIDLIYGLPGQTIDTWLYSVGQAISFQPEEIYLYPLYVRPLTGMSYSDKKWDDIRLNCYREARSLLLAEGYDRVSMRMFQKSNLLTKSVPDYSCQTDGMVGLGCGARSYTKELHYSSKYAVGSKGIAEILQAYIDTPSESFNSIDYGFKLDLEERQRRYIILSLLSNQGLKLDEYKGNFGTNLLTDYPKLLELLSLNLAIKLENNLRLTDFGVERSDTIGHWLFSNKVSKLMEDYELK